MTNHTFVLKDEKAFASGAFENTAYADGALRLEQYAGRYVQAGCYTTPEISAPAFNALVASWNAATPAGTAVELAVRVFAAGAWTPWMPYGKWSPFLRRASLPVQHPEDAALIWIPTWSIYVRPAVLPLFPAPGPAFIQTTCAVPPRISACRLRTSHGLAAGNGRSASAPVRPCSRLFSAHPGPAHRLCHL